MLFHESERVPLVCVHAHCLCVTLQLGHYWALFNLGMLHTKTICMYITQTSRYSSPAFVTKNIYSIPAICNSNNNWNCCIKALYLFTIPSYYSEHVYTKLKSLFRQETILERLPLVYKITSIFINYNSYKSKDKT